MEALTASCVPLCGNIGHQYVQLMAWRCQHHGAVTVTVNSWRDTPEGTEEFDRRTLSFGPFDTSADVMDVLADLAAMVGALLDGG